MDPIMAGALITGGASLLGGYMNNQNNARSVAAANAMNLQASRETNLANITMTRETNRLNADQAKRQMEFQAGMSNTAYQRATRDMKAAGINPIMAYAQGGASTPAGASASMQTARSEAAHAEAARSEDVLTPAIASALDYRRLQKEIAGVESQNQLNQAMKETQHAQKALNEANAQVARKNAEALSAQMPAIKQKSRYEEKRDKINEQMTTPDAILRRLQQATGIISDATSAIRPKFQLPSRKKEQIIIDKNTGEIIHESTLP